MEQKKKPKLELLPIPPLTIDEEAYLIRERYPGAIFKRMTRSEIEEMYPGAFDKSDR